MNHRTYCWIRFCYEAGFWSILYCTYQRNILGSEYCYICSSIHCDLQDKRALIRLIFSRSLCQTHFVHSHTNMVIFSWMRSCRSFIVCRSEGLWMVLQGRWQWQWFFLLCTCAKMLNWDFKEANFSGCKNMSMSLIRFWGGDTVPDAKETDTHPFSH